MIDQLSKQLMVLEIWQKPLQSTMSTDDDSSELVGLVKVPLWPLCTVMQSHRKLGVNNLAFNHWPLEVVNRSLAVVNPLSGDVAGTVAVTVHAGSEAQLSLVRQSWLSALCIQVIVMECCARSLI
jgi:hypothetical protein